VVGGLPKNLRDIAGARMQVREALHALLPYARQARVPLGIEPLHPMYAADRACVNTLAQANDLCDELGEGAGDHYAAMETCLAILHEHAGKIDGIKISLLSKEKEISMRRRLPDGVRMYTGDDFNYAELIAGDEDGYSDALLGIFDALAPAASAALGALTRGEVKAFHDILAPTVPLSRHIFKAPTRFYKTGVVFMAYLNGLQDHFTLIGGQESARSTLHLAELFRLADAAGLLADPERAAACMHAVLATRGVAA